MKISLFLMILVQALIISSCGSNVDKSEYAESNKNEGSRALADTIIDAAQVKDTVSPNVPIKNEEGKDTLDHEPPINAFISVDEDPEPVNLGEIYKAIGYPAKAKEAGIQGNVIVRVLVGENGEYLRHKIVTNTHPLLSNSVDLQVKNLRFTPAMKAGQPVKVWINLPFRFKLAN